MILLQVIPRNLIEIFLAVYFVVIFLMLMKKYLRNISKFTFNFKKIKRYVITNLFLNFVKCTLQMKKKKKILGSQANSRKKMFEPLIKGGFPVNLNLFTFF